jgi:hypothetical protein
MQSALKLGRPLWAALASARILRYGELKKMMKRQLSAANTPAITRTDTAKRERQWGVVIAWHC